MDANLMIAIAYGVSGLAICWLTAAAMGWLMRPRGSGVTIIGADSDIEEAAIQRCWQTGKTVVATRRDDGTIEMEEFE